MNRTKSIYWSVLLWTVPWTGLLGGSLRAAEQPNILWITVEDMSPRLGCYGDKTVPTPNLDRLAEQSTRYTHAFGVYGVCAPNRHCLIMGMYPTSTGAMAMRTWKRTSALNMIQDPELLAIPTYEATPPAEARCFTEYLRAAGYYCSNNAKTDYQFRDPITAWDESGTSAHWRNRPAGKPFFSVFNFLTTHESKTFQQISPQVVDPSQVEVPPYYADVPLVRRDIARHYDNIAAVDAEIGALLAELTDDGLDAETIVFFFSDHGDGLPRMKRWVYDSGIRVPLLVRMPDQRSAGQVNNDLVSFVDFAPTVLRLAGVEIPPHMQGQPFLGDGRPQPREYVFAARDRMDPAPETIRAVRDHRFKYVRNYRPDLPYIGFIPYRDQSALMQEMLRLEKEGKLANDQWQFWAQRKPLEELYDTHNDPHEIKNLAGQPEHFEKLAELRAAHQRWTDETADLGHMPESELIRHLWPPDGKQPRTATPRIEFRESPTGQRIALLQCPTAGASIAYRIGDQQRWLLYTEPVVVPRQATVYARANRLGWQHSEVATGGE